jgi:crotonobetainyl-CoA:carnitine CoA-transferase CaiB-like acyl-CoA transferase
VKPLEGIRVIEVAAWTFVPAAGAVLAEWGAEVLKIETPEGGDPQRGLVSSGLVPAGPGGANFFVEQPNHGKKSVAINLQSEEGRQALYKLCESADVFLTSSLANVRRNLKIDVEDIRAVNPDIIYVRGTGQGPNGPDAEVGGYDAAAFYARAGVMFQLSGPQNPYGPSQPPAFGDLPGGQTIAGAISTALLRRERFGETSVVDVSLLSFGMWVNAPSIVMSQMFGFQIPPQPREGIPNALVNRYRTSDDRLIQLVMLQGARYWPETITALGRPDLADDERFATEKSLNENKDAGMAILDEIFASMTFEDAKQKLAGVKGVWAPVQSGIELQDDPQVQANGYIAQVESASGETFPLVTNPVQFDEQPNELTRAPDLGEHTDDALRAAGYDDEQIIELKLSGAIL